MQPALAALAEDGGGAGAVARHAQDLQRAGTGRPVDGHRHEPALQRRVQHLAAAVAAGREDEQAALAAPPRQRPHVDAGEHRRLERPRRRPGAHDLQAALLGEQREPPRAGGAGDGAHGQLAVGGGAAGGRAVEPLQPAVGDEQRGGAPGRADRVVGRPVARLLQLPDAGDGERLAVDEQPQPGGARQGGLHRPEQLRRQGAPVLRLRLRRRGGQVDGDDAVGHLHRAAQRGALRHGGADGVAQGARGPVEQLLHDGVRTALGRQEDAVGHERRGAGRVRRQEQHLGRQERQPRLLGGQPQAGGHRHQAPLAVDLAEPVGLLAQGLVDRPRAVGADGRERRRPHDDAGRVAALVHELGLEAVGVVDDDEALVVPGLLRLGREEGAGQRAVVLRRGLRVEEADDDLPRPGTGPRARRVLLHRTALHALGRDGPGGAHPLVQRQPAGGQRRDGEHGQQPPHDVVQGSGRGLSPGGRPGRGGRVTRNAAPSPGAPAACR